MAEWLFIALFFCESAYSKVCMLHLSAFIPISLFFTLRWEFEKSRDVWQRLCRSFPLIIFLDCGCEKYWRSCRIKSVSIEMRTFGDFSHSCPGNSTRSLIAWTNVVFFTHLPQNKNIFNLMWTLFGDVRHSSFLASAKHSGYTVEVTSSGAFTLTSKKAEPKVGHL